MLFILDDHPQNLVLHVSFLDCIIADLSINDSEVWSKVLTKSIIPVFKAFTWFSRAIIARITFSFPGKSIVELILRSESTVKLIFKLIHKLSIPKALVAIVPKSIVVNHAGLSIVRAIVRLTSVERPLVVVVLHRIII